MKKELYTVLNGKNDFTILLKQIQQVLSGGIDKIQLYNAEILSESDLGKLIHLCQNHRVPLLIYNNLDLALNLGCQGVHLDEIPKNWNELEFSEGFIKGITVSNDAEKIQKAVDLGFDYISFCSLFPTESVANCEIVSPEIIQNTIHKFQIPIYVAGGIKNEHLDELKHWNIKGIVMISNVLNSKNIAQTIQEIKEKINE